MDIKRLLNQKTWTGRELGRLEIAIMAAQFKQAIQGETPQPLINKGQFQQMLNSITDAVQRKIYNGYIEIHEWLSLAYNIAQSNYQSAQLQYKNIFGYILQAELAEDTFSYIESLPVIMTEKQYKQAAENGRHQYLYWTDEKGEEKPRGDNALALIYRAIEHYIKLLADEPKKPNPLKPIRKKYLAAKATNPLILSRYNEATDNGYYILEDGRRSDQMSQEDWQAAISTPQMREALEEMEQRDELGRGHFGYTAKQIAFSRIIQRAKYVYEGKAETEEEAARLLAGEGKEDRLTLPATWKLYETPPEDLTKWEILEDGDALYNIFRNALGGEEADTAEETSRLYLEEAQAFIAEFKEAVAAIIADIKKHYNTDIDTIPVESWECTVYEWPQLYELDFYGFRSEADAFTTIFSDNWRAMANGVAILQPKSGLNKPRFVDEQGNYTPPPVKESVKIYSLAGFFTDADEYAERIEEIEQGREALLDAYYFIKGYNYALDLIAAEYEIPEINIFKSDIIRIEEQIDAINSLIPMLYNRIKSTEYEDKELQQRKLQVLRDIFPPIDYKAIDIPAERIVEAQEAIKDFKAFKKVYGTRDLGEILFYRDRHQGGGGNE